MLASEGILLFFFKLNLHLKMCCFVQPAESLARTLPTLLPPPRDPLISGLGAPRRNARYCRHRSRRVFLQSDRDGSEGGRERNGAPLFNFHAFFYNLPFTSLAALSWATSKCLRRRPNHFYLYFEYGSGSESPGSDSHFGQNLGLRVGIGIRDSA